MYIDYKDEEFLKLAISLHQTGKYLSDKQQRDNLIAIYKSLNEIPICNQIEFEF